MHILIDVQGLQSDSKYRGIGRSTLSMSKAIICNAGKNRVSILLNGMFSLSSISNIRQIYSNILPSKEIFIFFTQGPSAVYNSQNLARNRIATISRDVAIANINPDIVFVTSFFEGYIDQYVVSIPDYPVRWRTVCVCHDLIPIINADIYLKDPRFKKFYIDKLREYERADGIFAISKSAANEVKQFTNIKHDLILNISSAVDSVFCVTSVNSKARYELRMKYGLPDNFILSLAMIEPRKNIYGLIRAFGTIPETLRNLYPLVLVCKIQPLDFKIIQKLIKNCGIKPYQIVFTGYLPDSDLISLYNLCKLFVFPSFHEGFGLPPLEAMSCGAATLSSNTTSLPEIIGWSEAMFNPKDIKNMAKIIEKGLTDESFYLKLKEHALKQSMSFSWNYTAKLAWKGFAKLVMQTKVSLSPCYSSENFINNAIKKIVDNNFIKQDIDRLGVAWSLAYNNFNKYQPRLLLDASALITNNSGKSINRIVRNIFYSILKKNIDGYQIRLIYYRHENIYYYANRYYSVHFSTEYEEDSPVLFYKEDIVVIPNPNFHLFYNINLQLNTICRSGAKLFFIIHNNISMIQEYNITKGYYNLFYLILNSSIKYADGVICTSGIFADKLRQWITNKSDILNIKPNLIIDHFHLGIDYEDNIDLQTVPNIIQVILDAMSNTISFLMVSNTTLFKDYIHILEAFEIIWKEDKHLILVLANKDNHDTKHLCHRIYSHPELNKRLFYLNNIKDEFLGNLYKHSNALIISSYEEDLVVLLIKAAKQSLSLILLDIPFFREIAGEHVLYFSKKEKKIIKDTIISWIALNNKGMLPDSGKISWITWKKSTDLLISKLLLSHFKYKNNTFLIKKTK